MDFSLIEKYDVPVPRYTSYPTVPLWENREISGERWIKEVLGQFEKDGSLSLYVHLPYCESLCTYCGCNKHITKNHLVEKPYVDAVLKEWRMYTERLPQKPLLRELHLGGGTPTFFAPAQLERLVKGLLAEAEVPEQHEFSFEAHPHSTTKAHLEVLYNLGFNRISLGVQDFDSELMAIINRQQEAAEVARVTREARTIGYRSVNFDLIYGLPRQKPAHMEANLAWVKELRPDRIAFYSYAHIPDVARGQRAYSEEDLPRGFAKYRLHEMGSEAFKAMGYVDIGMDHFALASDDLARSQKKRQLHRNFMGYTPYHTYLTIALGASAISDSWSAFAQNEKHLATYLRRIREEDYPPLIKSHYHSAEDLQLRRKILDLICHFSTQFWDMPQAFEQHFRAGFEALAADDLCRLRSGQVKVTPKGQSFLRNICAVLDRRMHSAQDRKATFSRAI